MATTPAANRFPPSYSTNARLSGETAMRLFRWMGKPAFITSRDLTAALIGAGVSAKPPTGMPAASVTIQPK